MRSVLSICIVTALLTGCGSDLPEREGVYLVDDVVHSSTAPHFIIYSREYADQTPILLRKRISSFYRSDDGRLGVNLRGRGSTVDLSIEPIPGKPAMIKAYPKVELWEGLYVLGFAKPSEKAYGIWVSPPGSTAILQEDSPGKTASTIWSAICDNDSVMFESVLLNDAEMDEMIGTPSVSSDDTRDELQTSVLQQRHWFEDMASIVPNLPLGEARYFYSNYRARQGRTHEIVEVDITLARGDVEYQTFDLGTFVSIGKSWKLGELAHDALVPENPFHEGPGNQTNYDQIYTIKLTGQQCLSEAAMTILRRMTDLGFFCRAWQIDGDSFGIGLRGPTTSPDTHPQVELIEALLSRTGTWFLHQVAEPGDKGLLSMPYDGVNVRIKKSPFLSWKYFTDTERSRIAFEKQEKCTVSVRLTREGGRLLSRHRAANVGRKIAIVIDEGIAKILPNAERSNTLEIPFDFSSLEDRVLYCMLRSGALPCKVMQIEKSSR